MPRKYKPSKQSAQIQQSSTFQYLVLLIILTVLNISFFFGYSGSSEFLSCSTDSVIQVVALYLSNNGQSTIQDLLPSQCKGYSGSVEKDLQHSVRTLMTECRRVNVAEQNTSTNNGPVLTLFTTFAAHLHSDSEKLIVHNNTLVNWASFKPALNLILFTNDTYWTKVAKQIGWDVIPPLHDEKNGTNPPVLKDLFHIAMKRYDTTWFGYMNADILFTSDLISNLDFFSKKYNTRSTRILLTGRRTNVDNLTELNPLSETSIREGAEKYGKLYREDAEDFFITTKSFPWKQLIPVVVGRPGYDNWLVGEARCRLNTTVVDVTQTFLAFHQTTRKGGNSEGHLHPNSDFNFQVLKRNNIVPNFLAGLTDCIIYNTYRTFCDVIDIAKRSRFGPGCNCNMKKKHS